MGRRDDYQPRDTVELVGYDQRGTELFRQSMTRHAYYEDQG